MKNDCKNKKVHKYCNEHGIEEDFLYFAIDFDYCSTGFWGSWKEGRKHTAYNLGQFTFENESLANEIKNWNNLFDRMLCITFKKEEFDYGVTKEVAQAMKPLGMLLARLVKKELPEYPIYYVHYWEDGTRRNRKFIEIKE